MNRDRQDTQDRQNSLSILSIPFDSPQQDRILRHDVVVGLALARSALLDQIINPFHQLRAEVIGLSLRMGRRVVIEITPNDHAAIVDG